MPLIADPRGCPQEFLTLLAHPRSRMDGPVLCSSWMLRPEAFCFLGAELFFRTMCEGSGIPSTWPSHLNHARALIVPSRFVADVFRAGGLTVPIAVVPDGVDPAIYCYNHGPDEPE